MLESAQGSGQTILSRRLSKRGRREYFLEKITMLLIALRL
jgi:hypothetical protein